MSRYERPAEESGGGWPGALCLILGYCGIVVGSVMGAFVVMAGVSGSPSPVTIETTSATFIGGVVLLLLGIYIDAR